MTAYVLVHGSWHGGWCWQQVVRRLEAAGHRVVAPDLPGHGADATPPGEVTLAAYAARVIDAIDAHGGGDPVVLVGHSMAGIVISEVAERVPHRVGHLVYLAAALLEDGEAMLDLTLHDEGSHVNDHLLLHDDSVTLDPAGVVDCFYADCDPLDAAWATTRLVPEPLAPLAEPIHVTAARWGRIPRTYLACAQDRALSPAVQRARCERVGVDRMVTLPSAHSPFLSDPDLLADLLTGIEVVRPEHLLVDAGVRADLTWRYRPVRTRLTRLYEKGKTSQWNATTDIDWSPDVEFGTTADVLDPAERRRLDDFLGFTAPDAPTARFDDAERAHLGWCFQSWMVNQFLHGEQGALVASARLIETVPDLDAKTYAASQVADEARHVEVYARYLDEKLGDHYAVSAPLEALLVDIMTEPRWDITYLGMQIMVEGLALAAFSLGHATFRDPVIRQITDYVMKDEARHVAFGVLALSDLYPQLTSAELADREDFVLEATHLLYERFLLDQVWDRVGIDARVGRAWVRDSPFTGMFRHVLFSKIVPNITKLGLLTPRVRERFTQLDVIRWEHEPDAATAAGLGA